LQTNEFDDEILGPHMNNVTVCLLPFPSRTPCENIHSQVRSAALQQAKSCARVVTLRETMCFKSAAGCECTASERTDGGLWALCPLRPFSLNFRCTSQRHSQVSRTNGKLFSPDGYPAAREFLLFGTWEWVGCLRAASALRWYFT
jgi:hypothetical protein